MVPAFTKLITRCKLWYFRMDTGECRGGGLIEIGRQVVRPRAAAAAAAAAEAASMPHKPNHKVHKIKQLMPQSKLAITLTFYLIFLKSSASAISIAQVS